MCHAPTLAQPDGRSCLPGSSCSRVDDADMLRCLRSEHDDTDAGKSKDFEVRYSDKFARELQRSNRRGLLFGGLGFLVLGIEIVRESIVAHATGTMVNLGGMRSGPDLWPWFIAAPVGVAAAIIGIGLLVAWIVHRKRS